MAPTDNIRKILKTEQYANPFCESYDRKKILDALEKKTNEEEQKILTFLDICHGLACDIKKHIHELFDQTNFSSRDLRDFCFTAVNKYFLDFTPVMYGQVAATTGKIYEAEKSTFSKFTNVHGQEISAQLAVEIGGDILSELIALSYQWSPSENAFSSLEEINNEIHGPLFHKLWILTNTYLNIRCSAYEIVVYENGMVSFKNENRLKIKSGLHSLQYLNTVGQIRKNSNIQEASLPLLSLYSEAFRDRKGVQNYRTIGSTLEGHVGECNISIVANAYASILAFYPHFKDEKIAYFDGLTLLELLDMVLLIEGCTNKLIEENISDYSERDLQEVPTRFKESYLIDLISKCTEHGVGTIKKFLSALTANRIQPYFWRDPLYQADEYLYFSLAALAGPNYCLYLDKWTAVSGYTLEDKEVMLRNTVYEEFTLENNIPYEFETVDAVDLGINDDRFKNNLIVRTRSYTILLEVKVFGFPIESPEIERAFLRLGRATADLKEKLKTLESVLNEDRSLLGIVLTNYNSFSSACINDVPVIDLTLLKNYFFVGQFKRAMTNFQEGRPVTNNVGVVSYYTNEDEFNNNIESFLANPVPVRHILDRLESQEQQITPDFIKPKFVTDSIGHVSDESLMKLQTGRLSDLLNYEYYTEPEKHIGEQLNESIYFSLSEIFHKLAYAPYESQDSRVNIYYSISKVKSLGIIHLSFFMLKAIERINAKRLIKSAEFETVDYDPEKVLGLLDKINIKGPIRPSEFSIPEGQISEDEERQLISFSIDMLSGLTPANFSEDVIEVTMVNLTILQGFKARYAIESKFYSGCGNLIDALNHTHKYQRARDFCEEVLLLSIREKRHSQGWSLLFRCYTFQQNHFDTAIYGCLFISSISILPEIPNALAVDALYGALKFFRNLGYFEFAKLTYENLSNIELSDYDSQKVSLSYFNSFLKGPLQENVQIINQVIEYFEKHLDSIVGFGDHGIVPWLAFFYNVTKIRSLEQTEFDSKISDIIATLELSATQNTVFETRTKIIGDFERSKELFISAALNTFETRSASDFVYESHYLRILAGNLVRYSYQSKDIDGLLLSGLAINDQSFTYKNIYLEPGSVSPFFYRENTELRDLLQNYRERLLSHISLSEGQVLVWIFAEGNTVYLLNIDYNKNFRLDELEEWSLIQMKSWLSSIDKFYFNSRSQEGQNNPRAESPYDLAIQEEDYESLEETLSFTQIKLPENSAELLFYSSINIAPFPHNLIMDSEDFVSARIPVCNVLSLERFKEHHRTVLLDKNYSVSAWIPTDDGEPTISWGYEILAPLLTNIGADMYTSTYPTERITTDFNIFLAHGVLDRDGFKAVYTNHQDGKGIVYPHSVFGQGKIAVLFVCNSGSANDALYSNSIVSFSGELLKSGYEAVAAPFWPFDVTMSKIWLGEFVKQFNSGLSVCYSLWHANKKLANYDEETSNIFHAPAGQLAMHLYGNPNIYCKVKEPNPLS